MNTLIRFLRVLALALLLGHPTAFAQTAEEAAHIELRALNQRLVDAMNKKDPEALFAETTADVEITAINNDHVKGIDQGKAYFQKMFTGAASVLNDMSITSEPDAPSRLYLDNQVAISTGQSKAHLSIRGGLTFDAPLRWTATLERTGGAWKLAAIHFSADIGNNPFIGAATYFWKIVAAAAGLLALLVGFLVGRRRRGA
jgi:ketosteroid isomerase-like protein